MKKFRLSRKLMMGAAIACALSISFTSCDDDDDDDNNGGGGTPPPSGAPTKKVSFDVSSNTTWSKDTIYVLTGRIKVRPPAELTIQPGTIIKGEEGQAANAKALLVMRGAKLIADGTAAEPIIFTSIKDPIQPGEIASTTPSDLVGQWGGLAILGKGIIADNQDQETENGVTYDVAQIEGVPSSDLDGRYGGADNDDNSGVLRYVSVRHGGTQLANGDELNGISFGGVGRGTVVENVEVVANADDGLEFYGGAVNATNIIIWNNGDDALDTDNGYIGTISNFVLVGPAGSPMELDGPEGSTTTITGKHTLENGTVVATRSDAAMTAAGDLLNYDNNTNFIIRNVHFRDVTAGQQFNPNDVTTSIQEFSDLTIDVPTADIPSYINGSDATLTGAISSGTTGKADVSVLTSWSWAGADGALTGL